MVKVENRLYILLNSREIVIFDWKQQKVEVRVQFSDHTITCIHVTPDHFLFSDTFSFIYAIKLTEFYKEDVKNPDLKKLRLLAHEGWILSMFHHEKFLYTCSDDKSIKVWDISTCKLQTDIVELKDELYGHKNGVCSITIANDHLFTGSYDQSIRSWSIENIEERIRVRQYLKVQEEYSTKAEAYKSYLDAKKKKKKGKKGKSANTWTRFG